MVRDTMRTLYEDLTQRSDESVAVLRGAQETIHAARETLDRIAACSRLKTR